MIRRDLHPICDNCWNRVVGIERYKVRDKHHFFTFNGHPPCCWCNSPTHGQWWQMKRLEAPCQGFRGFHAESPSIIDLDELRKRYREEDPEVVQLIDIARGLQKEVAALEKEK